MDVVAFPQVCVKSMGYRCSETLCTRVYILIRSTIVLRSDAAMTSVTSCFCDLRTTTDDLQHAHSHDVPGAHSLSSHTLLKKMLMIELKKIRTEKYMMSANCVAMSDTSMIVKGTANNLWSIRRDHAMILMGLGTDTTDAWRIKQSG